MTSRIVCQNILILTKTKINCNPILINNIRISLFGNLLQMFEFSAKTATWANNISVNPHTKAKFINSLWRLTLELNYNFLLGN